tara:strand:- start:420100 stop:420465 length:366 start_codon:yes stop_codon:yes gene_type:complete
MPEDKRQQPRFPVENTVFIELVAPEFGSKESGVIARCKSVEASRDGLRVTLEQELAVGAILEIGLELPANVGTLYLVGEVIWSEPIPATGAEPAWAAGFVLFNAAESDIESWISLITAMES